MTFVLPTEQSHLGKIEELLSGGKSPALSGRGMARLRLWRLDAVEVMAAGTRTQAAATCMLSTAGHHVPPPVPVLPWVAGTVPYHSQAS